MAKTRKDSRGYALHTGETQRKDGRYVYTYTNIHDKRKSIYANSLTELRKKERKSIRDREDGLDPDAADHITLNQMFDKYYAQKYNLKETTRSNYKYMYDHFVRDTPDSNVITIRHVVSVYCLMCFSASCISPSSVAPPSLPSTLTSSGNSTQEQYPGCGW